MVIDVRDEGLYKQPALKLEPQHTRFDQLEQKIQDTRVESLQSFHRCQTNYENSETHFSRVREFVTETRLDFDAKIGWAKEAV